MAYRRQRRAGDAAQTPPYPMDEDGDRLYSEDDYAADPSVPDEWEADAAYLPEGELPDEAFLPDKEEWPDPEHAPASDDEAWQLDPFSAPGGPFAYAPDLEDDELLDGDPLAEDLLTEEEQAELKRSNWKLIAGLADFAGVIVGTAAILVLVTILVSLINWLMADISQSFVLLQKNF